MRRYPPPLAPEEQLALCRRAQAGDLPARDRLVLTSMTFVIGRALFYAARTPGADPEELANAGAMGVLTAIAKFAPAKGVKFITYAAHWINNEIRLATHVLRDVRNSDAKRNGYLKAYRAQRARGLDHDDALEAVGAQVHAYTDTVAAVVASLSRAMPLSLDASVGDDGISTLLTFAASEDRPADEALEEEAGRRRIRARIDAFRHGLSVRDRAIVDERIAADREDVRTLQELGVRYGCSRERIRQIEVVLRGRLRVLLAPIDHERHPARSLDPASSGSVLVASARTSPDVLARVRELRERGLSLRAIVAQTGLSRATIARYAPRMRRSEALRRTHARWNAKNEKNEEGEKAPWKRTG